MSHSLSCSHWSTRVVVVVALFLLAGPAQAQDSCRARRVEADRLVRARAYTEAASIYAELVRAEPRCPAMDEVLYNLALAYSGAGLLGRAIQVRQVLIQRFPTSPHAGPAVYLQGAAYHAIAFYSEAARHYLNFAGRYPDQLGDACTAQARADGSCPDATIALENAIFFYWALGDRASAVAGAALYARSYGTRRPQETASIAFAVGMHRDIEDPETIGAHAEELLRTYDAIARLDQRARTLIALARARLTQGRRDEAAAALARVIALVTPEALASLGGTDAGILSRFRSRDALAEALFLSAEQRAVVIAQPPAYRGPRTEAGMRAWLEGPFSAWRDRQLQAIAAPLDEYGRVAERGIPQWTIAALERMGALHSRVLGAGESVSAPSWAESDAELVDSFAQARERTLERVRASALETYERCAGEARMVRSFSAESERCEDALVALDPSHHSAQIELHGEPVWTHDDVARPEPVRRATDE